MLPFQDTSLTPTNRVEDLLKRLTLEEKIRLCHQVSPMKCGGVPRLGIPPVTFSDGPQGFRLEDGRTATALPCGVSLASTWDEQAAEKYGAVIGREGNALGIQGILGPGMNLMRTPLNGRTFEYFGEDPYLSGSIASGYVRGCQHEGVAACPKHLALNNQEICRSTGDSRADERTIRDFYLRSFQILCAKSAPWMMMSSYNKINGTYASENRQIQQEIAKDEFGFDGVMVSDWGAAHSTMGCALGGLDLDMGPNPEENEFAAPLLKLVKDGKIPESVIDEKARRLIRLMLRTGLLNPEKHPAGELNTRRNQQDARELAAAGMVLLRNNGLLPLDRKKLKKIAVIGPAADFKHNTGSMFECGGSGAVHPPYDITPLQGIRAVCGRDVKVCCHPGCSFSDFNMLPADLVKTGRKKGLLVEYFHSADELRNGGKPFLTRVDKSFNYLWCNRELAGGMNIISGENFAVRWTGKLTPQYTGKAVFRIRRSVGALRCLINGQVIFDEFAEKPGWSCRRELQTDIAAEAGKTLNLTVEYETRELYQGASVRFLWQDTGTEDFSAALKSAEDADAVIYIGGTSHEYDKEGIGWGNVPYADIPDLELPGPQKKLISALAAVNPKLAVVLINGSVVSLKPWLKKSAAVLEAWYGGMESGRAIADVLFGKAEPGGRLPCTFAEKLNDYACHALKAYPGVRTGDNPHVEYPEGIFIGYRHFDTAGIKPEFPFGFGLSYTEFCNELTAFEVRQDSIQTPEIRVACRVKNTGKRRGEQVIQLYVGDVESSEKRPMRELRGFRKLYLNPGESGEMEFLLNAADFSYWSQIRKEWVVEPGKFVVELGTSSRNIFASSIMELR